MFRFHIFRPHFDSMLHLLPLRPTPTPTQITRPSRSRRQRRQPLNIIFLCRFGNVLELDFGQNSVNFQDVSQASISNIIFVRFCYFFDTPQPEKPLFSCRKTRISIKTAFNTSHWKNTDFMSILASFFDLFGIIFHHFFGIDFCMDVWRHFGRVLMQNGSKMDPKIHPKTLQKRIRKNIEKTTLICSPGGGIHQTGLGAHPLAKTPRVYTRKLVYSFNSSTLTARFP